MYLSRSEFKAIEKVLMMLPSGKSVTIDGELDESIHEAWLAMMNVYKRNKKSNEKTAAYIAEKRKTNKNYARGNRK